MINLRKALAQKGHIAKIVAKYDFLYDATGLPDFYFSSIGDFLTNNEQVQNKKCFEIPRAQYILQEGNQIELRDQTNSLIAKIKDDYLENIIRYLFSGATLKQKISAPDRESFLHQVCLKKSENEIQLLNFADENFPSFNKEKDYLAFRFPQLVQTMK